MKIKILLLLLCFQNIFVFSQNGFIDTNFFTNDFGHGSGFGSPMTTENNTLFLQSNGKLIVGSKNGNAKYNGRVKSNLIRINQDGLVDTAFVNSYLSTQYIGTSTSGVELSNGNILISGQYSHSSGTSKFIILDSNGYYLNKLGTNSSIGCGTIKKMIVLSDGSILVSGNFCSMIGASRKGIAKIFASQFGISSSSFNPQLTASSGAVLINDMVVQQDGKIIIAGNFITVDGISRNGIARLNVNGTLDTSFDPGVGIIGGEIKHLEITGNGKLVISGNFSSYNASPIINLARINLDGTVDPTFNSPFTTTEIIWDTYTLLSGSVIVIGDFYINNGNYYTNIKKVNSFGQLDLSFTNGVGLGDTRNSLFQNNDEKITKLPDGNFNISGRFSYYNNKVYNGFIKLDSNGFVLTDYNSASYLNNEILDFAVLQDSSMLVYGSFNAFNGNPIPNLIKLKPDGIIDSTFNCYSADTVIQNGFIALSDGSIIRKISYYTGFTWKDSIIKLNPDGSKNMSFLGVTGVTSNSFLKATPAGNSFLITVFEGANFKLKKILSNGTIDPTFTINANVSSVNDIGFNSFGEIFIVGNFTSFNGQSTNKIVKLDSMGNIIQLFPSLTINGNIQKIKFQSDNFFYILGSFTLINGVSSKGIKRFLPNSTIDTSFNVGNVPSPNLRSLFLQPNGKVILGSTNFNVTSNKFLLSRLYPDGTLDTSLYYANNSFNLESYISKIEYQTSDQILIAGTFQNWGNYGRNGFVRINNCVTEIGKDTVVACDFFTWINGVTYYSSTHAYHTIITSNNCDSLVELFLTVNYSTHSYDTVVSCDQFTWTGLTGLTYNLSGDYTDTLVNSVGCDSIVHLNLTILYSTHRFDTITSCNSYIWPINGLTYFTTGDYLDTLINSVGCDSIVHLNLFLSYTSNHFDTVSICNNYIWSVNSLNYTLSGDYIDTLQNQFGCDSIMHLNLTILPTFLFYDTVLSCQSYTWTQNNQTYFNSGIYYDSLLSINGCDSIYTLNLTIEFSNYDYDTIVECVNYTWPVNGQTYFSSGDYIDTLTNIFGCDSIFYLNLNLLNATNQFDTVVICNNYFWPVNSQNYTLSGDYIDTLLNQFGCDSIMHLNLTILPTFHFYDTILSCQSYTWSQNNQTYFNSGVYYDSLLSINGCDSIYTLNLTIEFSNYDYDTIVECENYTWPVNGQTYISSGNYSDTLTNIFGCDSIFFLNLTLINTTYQFDTVAICDNYTWPVNSLSYTLSGDYIDTLQNQFGCDSIIHLNLTILPTFHFYDTVLSCQSYTWTQNNQTYFNSGIYYDSLLSINGCDSIFCLNLTIIPSTISSTNTFSTPSSDVSCTGQLAITTTGNTDFEISIDGTTPFSSSGYYLQSNLCPGIHELSVIDFCGDTVSQPFVIPIDSNYVFNNPFIDSIAVDSLGVTITNCEIYYNSIDTAFIDSLWTTGNQVNVIWNIFDSNGSNLDTTTYDLMNGSGVYWLQLSVFCPTKAVDDYFTVTQAIYFGNGGAYLVGLEDNPELENSIGLYPNPTSNSVTVTFNSNSIARVLLLDAQGKFIQESLIQSGHQISLEHLERGVYFLNVEMDGMKYMKRIVKQ